MTSPLLVTVLLFTDNECITSLLSIVTALLLFTAIYIYIYIYI